MKQWNNVKEVTTDNCSFQILKCDWVTGKNQYGSMTWNCTGYVDGADEPNCNYQNSGILCSLAGLTGLI